MEQLAELDQDPDRLIQIIAADLSSGWQYLRIANLQGTRDAYREAATLTERIRHLHQRAGMPEAFPAWLDGLKAQHRRKRNLLAELSRRGL
jgi:uncharacterized Zn finger protein